MSDRIYVSLPPDADGYLGRECPIEDCLGVFKIRPGTGLTGEGLPCHCPYCGHQAAHDHFYTQEQVKYAQSMAMRQVTDAFLQDLKRLEFDHRPPPGGFGIGISLKVTPGERIPLHQIREPELQTEVTCASCSLDYAVFGLFAYCPDCGSHNSRQILERNLALTRALLSLAAAQADQALATQLVEDALENCVSAFDGFGRELVRVHAAKSQDPAKCQNVSFQNLTRASEALLKLFAIDLHGAVSSKDWSELHLAFMRRHLIAHRSGVIDQKYLDETGEDPRLLGRRLSLEPQAVEDVVVRIQSLGTLLEQLLSGVP